MKYIWRVFVLGSLLASLLGACDMGAEEKKVVEFAVAEARPLIDGQPNPHSVYAGALMAAEQINALGGISGYKVSIQPYSDEGNIEKAQAAANQIVASDAVAVIGHSTADTTLAAAPVYDLERMAAVIASPMTKDVISGYKGYFNISYTSEQQGAYLANYAVNVLDAKTALIVYEKETSRTLLAQKFENSFRGLGRQVITAISLENQPTDFQMQSAVGQIFSKNVDVLLIAASDVNSITLVKELRNRGFSSSIIGGDNLSTRDFIEKIQSESVERARPGYFTDGIISTRSLMPDSASGFSSQFTEDYREKYPDIPISNSAARGYDAALAYIYAAQSAIQENGEPTRENVLEEIRRMDDPKTTFYGITGPIYFGSDRLAVRQPLFGIYQFGHLVSAPIQYQPILIPENIPNMESLVKRKRVITLDGRYVYVTHIVYTGMDLIEIRDLDQKTSTYTSDFYLWFRYIPSENNSDFLPENIAFVNAQSISSNDLVRDETTGDGSAYKTFRISGVFKNEFNFRAYPFDYQDLVMQFRNQNAEAFFIQYVIDRPGMRYPTNDDLLLHLKNNGVFDPLYGWSPELTYANQSLFSTSSTLGDPLNFDETISTDFSLFDIHVRVERNSLAFVIKSLLPLLFTLILAYITFYLPIGHSERLGVGSTALLTTAFFHLSLASTLPEIGYTVAMEYFFYASYSISALMVFLETWSIRIENGVPKDADEEAKQPYEKRRQFLTMAGRILYPLILGAVLFMGGLNYYRIVDLNPPSDVIRRAVEHVAMKPPPAPYSERTSSTDSEIVLELSSWRPEDDASIRSLLEEFHKANPEIKIVHLPVAGYRYRDILSSRLSNGQGPDMFFMHPYERRDVAFTLDLTEKLPIEKNYNEKFLSPWRDADGRYYGLPYVGVIQGVYYNKEIFARLKLPIPQTWEEFLSASEVIKKAGYTPIANGLAKNEENDFFMSLAVNFIGGSKGRELYNVERGRCFNDSHSTRAFQSVLDMMPYMSEDFLQTNSYTSKQRFINQEAAMLFGGSWDVGYFTEFAKFDWDVFAPPALEGSQTYVIFQPDIAIGINKRISPEKQQAALQFLDWLMTKKSLSMSSKILPGFYPLISLPLDPVDNEHSAQFQKLAADYPTDVRWSYSEISVTNQLPTATNLIQQAQYDMVANGTAPQEATDFLQAGMAQWYVPAQSCTR